MTVKTAFEQTGLSMVEFARRAGLAYSQVFDLVNGRNKNPSHVTVVRLVRALRISGLPELTSADLFPVPRVIELPPDRTEDHA